LLIDIVALTIAGGLFVIALPNRQGESPRIPAVLCGSNGLSGSGVGISRIGSRRIDFLRRDNEVVVSLPRTSLAGCDFPPTNETATCHSQWCPLVRAQRVVMVRATFANNMASRVGHARHRLLLCISLVPNSEQPSSPEVRAAFGSGLL
jgi:hypothetical protein